jgi:hypothetical protein
VLGISDREMGELHLEHVKFSVHYNVSDDDDDSGGCGGGGDGDIKKGHFFNAEFARNEFSFPNSNVLVFF